MTQKLKNQKDSLARLMATENLTIVHKKIPTAYFDVKNRVLACPTFKDDISPELYDLFMGHEVGHALNTPYEGLHSTLVENKTLKGYLNVVEDVRIEKAIKQKYQGLRSSFFKAYNELMDRNFFGIKGRDLQSLSLIDKINMYFKSSKRMKLQFTKDELSYVEKTDNLKNMDDVIALAKDIINYQEKKDQEQKLEENDIKLDYKDVLIRPKRSTLKSRSQVRLERKFKFRNSKADYEGVPIMASNMDGVGTFEMADVLATGGIFTCLVKTYSINELVGYFDQDDRSHDPARTEYVAMSIGITDADHAKFRDVYEQTGSRLKYVCIDVANGYSERFEIGRASCRERV